MTPGNCGPAVAQNAVRCIHGTSVVDMVARLLRQQLRTGKPAGRDVVLALLGELDKCEKRQRCPRAEVRT